MYSGDTFHGYAESRVTLINRSPTQPHVVTLVFPNNSWNYGNAISRLSRTVKLAPGAHAVVPLLQPPLPVSGDGMMRVEIDGGGGEPNLIRMPNANNHMNLGRSTGSGLEAVALISRSLDYDAAARALNSGRGQFTAEMATDAADSGGRIGMNPNAWVPDTSRPGVTNWLELVYNPPLKADRLIIYHTQPLPSAGTITILGTSGANLSSFPMSGGSAVPHGRTETEFTLPSPTEPVQTVRFDFGRTPPASIGIDAVQLTGTKDSAWAAEATASSDNSSKASTYRAVRTGVDDTAGLRAEAPISEWSEDWLAYTPFDLILLNSSDLAAAPPSVTAALGNYLSAGGNIVVIGREPLPAAWRAPEKTTLPDGVVYPVGLGHCVEISQNNLAKLDPETTRHLRNTAVDSARYWKSLPHDAGAANDAFPVVENLKIPVRGIVIIMLAFIIVIGPVNIILLTRRQRRTWLLWTIPAISFVTTLMVFAYSLMREGITPDARIAGLTLLDQPNHHAATVGVSAFYCPLTPSGGLKFDYETEVTPLVQSGYGGSGSRREVDWTQLQNLRHGWVMARVPAHFHLRKSETRRERLQVENDHGQLSVVNGLGAPVKSLWLADAAGKIYHANNLAAGQKGGLLLARDSSLSEKFGVTGLNHDFGYTIAHADDLDNSAVKYLQPDTYIAVLDGNPFIENALGSAASPKRTRTAGVVFGILDAADGNGGGK